MYKSKTKNLFHKVVSGLILTSFVTSLLVNPVGAQPLPAPGTSVGLTASFQPPVLVGLKIHPDNPLLFDFLVDQGSSQFSESQLKDETEKLVKYFFAALTIPDKEVWVNLSPTEKDRIIPDALSQTTMGQTMLEQDYILKQLASSLTNPEEPLGQEFWTEVKAQVQKNLGTADVSMNTFNKVWIVPQKAEVLESQDIVVIEARKLKVMMDEDRSKQKDRLELSASVRTNADQPGTFFQTSAISSQVFKEMILPGIDQEVNEGKNFAEVRQIYNAVILAAWYKQSLKNTLLGKVYVDQAKVAGVETDDKGMKQRIYEQYLAAFKKGVYNLIQEEQDGQTGETLPRKYFSGGAMLGETGKILQHTVVSSGVMRQNLRASSGIHVVTVVGTENNGSEEERNVIKNAVEKQKASSPIDEHQHHRVHNEKVVDPSKYAFVTHKLFSFATFMDEALHNSQWGYYGAEHVKFAENPKSDSDFWTFPSLLSPIFGSAVAEQAIKMWDGMRKAGTLSSTENFDVVEFGAGMGQAAYDFLEYVQKQAQTSKQWKDFAGQLKYRIYERSSKLRERMKDKLAPFGNVIEVLEGDGRNPTAMIAEGSVKGLVFSNELPDSFGNHKAIFSRNRLDVAFVLPVMDMMMFEFMKDVGLSSEIASQVEQQSKDIIQELNLSDNILYFTPETFSLLMGALSGISPTEMIYRNWVRAFEFNEIYIPVNFVPQVHQQIIDHLNEYADGLGRALEDPDTEVVHYINLGAQDFMQGVGRILGAGYVLTIDYGGNSRELLKADLKGEWEPLRSFKYQRMGYDPYQNVGNQDVTIDIDFTALAEAGQKQGLSVAHYGPQVDLTIGTPWDAKVGGKTRVSEALSADREKAIMDFYDGDNAFFMLVQQKAGTDGHYNVFTATPETSLGTPTNRDTFFGRAAVIRSMNIIASSAIQSEYEKVLISASENIIRQFGQNPALAAPSVKKFMARLITRALDTAAIGESFFEGMMLDDGYKVNRLRGLDDGMLAAFRADSRWLNVLGVTEEKNSKGMAALTLSAQLLGIIDRVGGRLAKVAADAKDKDDRRANAIFTVETQRLAYAILNSSDSQKNMDYFTDFVERNWERIFIAHTYDESYDDIKKEMGALKEIGPVFLEVFNHLEAIFSNNIDSFELVYDEFVGNVMDMVDEQWFLGTALADVHDKLLSLDLSQAVLFSNDLPKAIDDLDQFVEQFPMMFYMTGDVAVTLESIGRVAQIGTVLQAGLNKLLKQDAAEAAAVRYLNVLYDAQGYVARSSSAVNNAQVHTSLASSAITISVTEAVSQYLRKQSLDGESRGFEGTITAVASATGESPKSVIDLLNYSLGPDFLEFDSQNNPQRFKIKNLDAVVRILDLLVSRMRAAKAFQDRPAVEKKPQPLPKNADARRLVRNIFNIARSNPKTSALDSQWINDNTVVAGIVFRSMIDWVIEQIEWGGASASDLTKLELTAREAEEMAVLIPNSTMQWIYSYESLLSNPDEIERFVNMSSLDRFNYALGKLGLNASAKMRPDGGTETVYRLNKDLALMIQKEYSAASSAVSGVDAPKARSIGGIDFDPRALDLQIKRNRNGVALPLPQQNLERINIQGISPVIINIVPVTSQVLPLLLGRTSAASSGV